MPANPSLILASASPRRAELLALTGWRFDRCTTDLDESPLPGESPRELGIRLAAGKAAAAWEACRPGDITLAADTLVVADDIVLGKPRDAMDARRMLMALRGRRHTVITAVALQTTEDRPAQIEVCETSVPMREYDEHELQTYIEGGSPFDKAGAYGIQDASFRPVDLDEMRGCYANVMGLPLCHLKRAFVRLGTTPPIDIPQACMRHTGYDCDVYPLIEKGEL